MVLGFKKNSALLMMKEEAEQGRDCNSPSSPTLPGDILYEILTHVALDDLLRRCRWVCRNWNALTHDSTFNHLHCQRTQSVSGFFVQNLQKNKYHTSFLSIVTSPMAISLDFMPTTNLKIEASSYQAQGLVCCVSQAHHNPPRYYVCKPITRQWRRIPNPKTRYYTEKMAIVVKKSHPLHYKIIRLSRSKKYGGLQCEIFDSKNWAWRMQLEDLKLPGLALESEILMNGSVHWLTFEERKQIFAFDIDKANWRLISLPQSESSLSLEGEEVETMNIDFEVHKKLVNCEGHLGLLYTTWTWIELWVMEDYLKETWKKKYRLSLEPLNQILGRGYSLLALDAMDTILVGSFEKLIWYNCTLGITTQVMKAENPTITLVHPVHPFKSDSVPCNLGSARKYPKEKEGKNKNLELGMK